MIQATKSGDFAERLQSGVFINSLVMNSLFDPDNYRD